MGGTAGQKIRLLYLADLLKSNTDEDNPLSATELIELLAKKGIVVERKAIYDDISVLCEYGMDIIKTRVPSRGYYLAGRDFEAPEIFLLTDAVQAADFISPKKTRELCVKLENSLSRNQAKEVSRQVYIDNRNKCANEEIYYSIDKISRAVNGCKKITFKYCKRSLSDSRQIITSEKEMTVSPYALTWSGDHYYLVCNNEKYDNLMHVRLDRMRKVEITGEQVRPFSEVSQYHDRFDVADYTEKTFNMYGGELKSITLRCNSDLLEQIIDRFSDKIFITDFDGKRFSFSVKAIMSDGLVNWIMQFGNRAEALGPAELRDMISKRAREISALYEK